MITLNGAAWTRGILLSCGPRRPREHRPFYLLQKKVMPSSLFVFVSVFCHRRRRKLVWLGGRAVLGSRTGDQQVAGSNPTPRCRVQPWASCLYTCASVTKQYNLVPANGRWCSAPGEVTAVLVESNGSLPPGLWLRSPAGWLPRTGISSVALHLHGPVLSIIHTWQYHYLWRKLTQVIMSLALHY